MYVYILAMGDVMSCQLRDRYESKNLRKCMAASARPYFSRVTTTADDVVAHNTIPGTHTSTRAVVSSSSHNIENYRRCFRI